MIEVPVEEGNRLVKKGEVLFRVDPTPYQLEVNTLEAQLVDMQGSQRELQEQAHRRRRRKIEESQSRSARGRRAARPHAQARRAVPRAGEDAAPAAASTWSAPRPMPSSSRASSTPRATPKSQARSSRAPDRAEARRQVKGEFAQVAQMRAQLENAKWQLEETTTRSPCDCYVVNLQLRPGGFVAGLPLNPVMTLLEAQRQVVALYNQNELHQVEPGNEVEFALKTLPGKIIKGKVDSVVWAHGGGQLQASGTLPSSGITALPPGRYAVKFDIAENDKELFLAAGAGGDAAIYTDHLAAVHIIRKVILRVGSYLNYLILKLH